MDFLDFDDSSSEDFSESEDKQHGGIIQKGIYTEFENTNDAEIRVCSLIKELDLSSKSIIHVGDVHKVADFGIDLKKKNEREEWKVFVKEHFHFLISYVSAEECERDGKIFQKIKALSKECDINILISLQRGSGFDEDDFHEFGSKAWYLEKLYASLNVEVPIRFYDDSSDHVNSINSLNNKNIKGVLVDYRDDRGKDMYSKYSYLERMDAIEDVFEE